MGNHKYLSNWSAVSCFPETAEATESRRLIQGMGSALRPSLPQVMTVIGFGFLPVVGYIDSHAGIAVSLAVVYLLPVSLIIWFGGCHMGVIAACAAVGISTISDIMIEDNRLHYAVLCWNALARLTVFLFAAAALSKIRDVNGKLAEAVDRQAHMLAVERIEHARSESEIRAGNCREQLRVAYELHDGICSFLAGVTFKANVLEQVLVKQGRPEAEQAGAIGRLLADAVGQARDLSHRCEPRFADSGELVPALQTLAAETERCYQIASTVRADPIAIPLSSAAGLHLYRIAQQAVDNAVKHGQAHALSIDVRTIGDDLQLVIRDSGVGLDAVQTTPVGIGLKSMRHRAELLGGNLSVISAPGRGTEIRCVIPDPHTLLTANNET